MRRWPVRAETTRRFHAASALESAYPCSDFFVGGDTRATKEFTSRFGEDEKTVTVQTGLVLLHMPLP